MFLSLPRSLSLALRSFEDLERFCILLRKTLRSNHCGLFHEDSLQQLLASKIRLETILRLQLLSRTNGGREAGLAELVRGVRRRAVNEVVHDDEILLRGQVLERIRLDPGERRYVELGLCRHEGGGGAVGSHSAVRKDAGDTLGGSLSKFASILMLSRLA